jgi:pimeloyl-ACP methyl ester carboxylesterase
LQQSESIMRSIEFKAGDHEAVRGVLFEPTAPRMNPGIIFVHGLLSSHAEFDDYPQKFCERGYVVLAVDLRGHGSSDGMRGLVSSERSDEDLEHALDFLEAQPAIDNNRIVLFGHSLGGDAVLHTAARDPRVRAVVAGATVGRLQDELSRGELRLYRIVDAVNRAQKRMTHKSLYLPYRVTYADLFEDPECQRSAQAKGFLQRTLPADNIPLLLQQDVFAYIDDVRVPTMIAQGERDRVVSRSSTRAVFEALTCTKVWYEVKGSGHSFAGDRTGAEAFDHIANWIDEVLDHKQAKVD